MSWIILLRGIWFLRARNSKVVHVCWIGPCEISWFARSDSQGSVFPFQVSTIGKMLQCDVIIIHLMKPIAGHICDNKPNRANLVYLGNETVCNLLVSVPPLTTFKPINKFQLKLMREISLQGSWFLWASWQYSPSPLPAYLSVLSLGKCGSVSSALSSY